ncbi:hypothetical protein [Kocuria rosea]|nr:hypothetical protein [Kocuria rosea]WIG18371.1 hypothetical protein QOY29_05435 [Kocuria rosea]
MAILDSMYPSRGAVVSPICRLQPRVCFMAAEPAIVVVAMTTT